MGVEIHLGAMVTDMDDDGVEITKTDGSTGADPRRHQGLGRRDTARQAWAATLADAAGAELDKAGRVVVEPDCSLPGHPEVFVVGDLMALDDLPGVAEVAMQSGAHAAHTIVRRLEGKPTKPFHYRDLGTLAVISRFRAVAKIGPLRGRRLRRLAAVARRAHHLPHRLQEPVRRADPLGGQLRRARALRAGADRALGVPGRSGPARLCLRFRPEPTTTTGDDHADQRDAHCRAERPHQRHPPAHGAHRQRADPAQRAGCSGARRGSNASDDERAEAKALRHEIQDKVKAEGLWAPHLPPEYGGMGIDFMAHAYMNEILAYAIGAASLFGVVAPNSGNQTILVKYGTEEQKQKWLLPLVEGTMQSGFSMTEPENAGSDPRSIQTTAVREGDEWVINGHKWFTSNGLAADFFIVMCRAKESKDDEGPGRMVQIIVPTSDARRHHRARHRHLGQCRRRTTARSATTTSASRWRTCWARSATGTGPPRTASAPAASSTA